MSILSRLARALEALVFILEGFVSTIADLKTAADKLAANDAALAAEVGKLHGSVENLLTVFEAVKPGLSQADQSQLDAAVAEVVSASADLATQTGAMSADAAQVDAANPPAEPAPAA